MKLLQTATICLLISLNSQAALGLNVGEVVPEFTLSAADGTRVTSAALKDKVVVIEWFNRGCPYVKKHYRSGDMQRLQKEFATKGVEWLVINSTHQGHRDYLTPAESAAIAKEWKIDQATLLLDADGIVGKQWEAKTTPHMFVVNSGTLVYQGAIDDNADVFSNPQESTNYVTLALNEVLAGKPVRHSETKPYGCSVKFGK